MQVFGGASLSGATLTVNGTLSVVSGTRGAFRLIDGTGLSVAGNISVYNGSLYFPVSLPRIKEVVGTVSCLENGTVIVAGTSGPSYTFRRIWIRQKGTFWSQVQSTRADSVVLEAGGTLSVGNGGKVIVGKELRWWGGTVTGNGVVETLNATNLVSSSTKFLLVSRIHGSNSGVKMYLVCVADRWAMVWVWQDRVSLQNKGLATWQRGVLVSQQASTLVNYDTLNLSASSPWVTGRPTTPLPLRQVFLAL